jgi:hypothetical protein
MQPNIHSLNISGYTEFGNTPKFIQFSDDFNSSSTEQFLWDKELLYKMASK